MEKFIPYELYLKLKEKGFNPQKQPNYLYYNGELVEVKDHYNVSPYEIAPTIEEVMKWLRENHNLFIVVFINDDTDNPVTYEIYEGVECVLCVHRYFSLSDWSKAEIDALEYVLDSLI